MPDDTDTTREISASPAPQDAGANVGSANPEISPAPPEAAADFCAPEPVNDAVSENKAGVVENGQGAEEPVENQAPVSEVQENAPEPAGLPDGHVSDEPEPGTAQILGNEPLVSNPQAKRSFARELLVKARNAIQSRKRKKLDKVMTLFLKNPKITNDEVEKLLHVSDATAARFLSQLEKENQIRQVGKTGHAVWYEKS